MGADRLIVNPAKSKTRAAFRTCSVDQIREKLKIARETPKIASLVKQCFPSQNASSVSNDLMTDTLSIFPDQSEQTDLASRYTANMDFLLWHDDC